MNAIQMDKLSAWAIVRRFEQQDREAQQTELLAASAHQLAILRGAYVLVAADVVCMRELLGEMLTFRGYAIREQITRAGTDAAPG